MFDALICTPHFQIEPNLVTLCLDFYTRLNVTGLALLPFTDMSRTGNAK